MVGKAGRAKGDSWCSVTCSGISGVCCCGILSACNGSSETSEILGVVASLAVAEVEVKLL